MLIDEISSFCNVDTLYFWLCMFSNNFHLTIANMNAVDFFELIEIKLYNFAINVILQG